MTMLNHNKIEEQLMNAEPEDRACAAAHLRGIWCKHDGYDVEDCRDCMKESFAWLYEEEYEPPMLENGDGLKPGDWIMVRDDEGDSWERWRFLAYLDGWFYVLRTYHNGFDKMVCYFKQARLPKDGE